MAGKLSPEDYDVDNLNVLHVQVEALMKNNENCIDSSESSQQNSLDRMDDSIDGTGLTDLSHNADEGSLQSGGSSSADLSHNADQGSLQVSGSSPASASTLRYRKGEEFTEQFEHGVYITFFQLQNGTKVFRRVRFSKRRFANQQAEEWWKENKDRVFKKYHCPANNTSSESPRSEAAPADEDDGASSSQT